MTAGAEVSDPHRSGQVNTDPADIEQAEDFPEAVVDGVSQFLGKPRARGWIHVYSAIIATIAGAALVAVSWSAQSNRA